MELQKYLIEYQELLYQYLPKDKKSETYQFVNVEGITAKGLVKKTFQFLALVELAHRALRLLEGTTKLFSVSDISQKTLLRATYETVLDCYYIYYDPIVDDQIVVGDKLDDNFLDQMHLSEKEIRAYRFLQFSYFDSFRGSINCAYYFNKTLLAGREKLLFKILTSVCSDFFDCEPDIERIVGEKQFGKIKRSIHHIHAALTGHSTDTDKVNELITSELKILYSAVKKPGDWREEHSFDEIVNQVSEQLYLEQHSDHTLRSLYMDHFTLYKKLSLIAAHSSFWGLSDKNPDDEIDRLVDQEFQQENLELLMRLLKLLRVVLHKAKILDDLQNTKLLSVENILEKRIGTYF